MKSAITMLLCALVGSAAAFVPGARLSAVPRGRVVVNVEGEADGIAGTEQQLPGV